MTSANKASIPDQNTLQRILRRGVSEIIVESEFVRLLQSGTSLRLKMGFDPSRPDIHLGHVVGLRKLRQLQELGHQVILIVGDWTAQIGDPSGQSATRPVLTHEEVVDNAQSYMEQFFKVIDKQRTQVVWQSEWFGKFSLADVINLTGRFTIAQFLERDDFARRFQAHRPIAITELLYPLLQAYDSVVITSDIEFGGTDQKFNLLVGREMQGMMDQRPQQCFLMPILVGTDGSQKMSKSLGNYIGVDETPSEMFGKVMSLPDSLVLDYFRYLTDVPDSELEEISRDLDDASTNPMEFKKRLAEDITAQFHSPQEGQNARSNFERVVQGRQAPTDEDQYVQVPVIAGTSTSDVVRLAFPESSRSQLKRLISEGAVEVDGAKITGEIGHKPGQTIKLGRRRFIKTIEAS